VLEKPITIEDLLAAVGSALAPVTKPRCGERGGG
jgi:hypothetical protein